MLIKVSMGQLRALLENILEGPDRFFKFLLTPNISLTNNLIEQSVRKPRVDSVPDRKVLKSTAFKILSESLQNH
jgi:hypothetical protein